MGMQVGFTGWLYRLGRYTPPAAEATAAAAVAPAATAAAVAIAAAMALDTTAK